MWPKKWARVLYISTYVALIVGIGVSLLVTGYDLVQQTLSLARGGGRYFYIFIIVGTYVATGVFSGIIALDRLLTVRKGLQSIPKRYMPISKFDIPNPVHKLISTELTRSAMIRHSTLPAPSHRGFAPPTQPHHPNSSYTPIVIQSAILIVSKAARFRKTSVHRRHETLRQYIYRARDDGLWRDDVTREGLQVWLETYESVRFGGIELSEAEFVATMKLVHFLLMEMKPPLSAEFSVDSAEWSSSSVSLGSVDESLMETDVPALVRSPSTRNDRYRDWDVLRQMDMILSSPRKSVDEVSLSSMIDHGSTFEHALDQEQNRRMRGGRLGEREGSVIYYDVKDD